MTNRLYKWGRSPNKVCGPNAHWPKSYNCQSGVSFALVRLAEPLPTVFIRHALLPLVSFVFSSSCSRSQQSQRWMSPFSSPLPHNFGIQMPFSTHLITQMLYTLNRSFPRIVSMIPKGHLWTVYWNQNIITQSWNSTKTSTSRRPNCQQAPQMIVLDLLCLHPTRPKRLSKIPSSPFRLLY